MQVKCVAVVLLQYSTTGAQKNANRLFFNFPFVMIIKEGYALTETYGQTDTVSHWQVK